VVNTAKEGVADANSFIVGKTGALLAYAAPEPGIEVPSAGYTFAWTGLMAGGGLTAAVMRWREEANHSDFFEVRMALDTKIVSADLGVFYNNAVSS
jgi:hypothetical protein